MQIIESYKKGYLSLIEESETPTREQILSFFQEYELKKNTHGRKGLEGLTEENYEGILYLDLSDLGLSQLPEMVKKLRNLKAINLSANPLSTIEGMEQLTNLEMVFLNDCDLQEFPQEIETLTKLTSLYLDGNMISIFPKEIFRLKYLTQLVLSDNELEEIPIGIGSLACLIDLRLNRNKIEVLPKELINLKTLMLLDLEANQIQILPKEMGEVTNLRALDLKSNNIEVVPEELGKLISLTHLHMQGNEIRNIPSSFKELKSLIHFCIGNSLESVPNDINKLTEVKSIDLSNNELSDLPIEIGELKNIIELDLSNNRFSIVPVAIRDLKNIEELNLSNNELTSIPLWVFDLMDLKRLVLSGNRIEVIPSEIKQLVNLKVLELGENLITSIPDQIGNLINLTHLNLGNNSIKSLPKEIGNLANLQLMTLHFNYITKLPPEVGRLTKISDLILDGNELVEYPVELVNLRRLNRLYLLRDGSNPLTNMPETKHMGLVELIEYLKGNAGENTHYVFWDIPNQMRTAFQQYLNVFPDYVEKCTGKEVMLDISKVQGGLKLSTKTTPELSIEEINRHLEDFLYIFINNNVEIETDDNLLTRKQIFDLRQFIRNLKSENERLKDRLQDYYEKVAFLGDLNKEKDEIIKALQITIRFFETQTTKMLELIASNNAQAVLVEKKSPVLSTSVFDPHRLLLDIIQKLTRMLERKKVERIEDLHNNDLAHWLRDQHY